MTSSQTVRVILREGKDEAEFDAALEREALDEPGIRIIISELKFDPTKPRGPLAPEKLSRVFAEKFDGYLKKGWLRLDIKSGGATYAVEPIRIDLPRIARGLTNLALPSARNKKVNLDLYFDPSGKGSVGIRHVGVVIVDDLKQLSAYGLEDSIYAGGYVRGFIDADFLSPLPARTGFEENREWISFLDLLDKQRPQVEAEVEELKEREREKTLSEIQRNAIELAKEILNLAEFKDLELPGGLTRARRPPEDKRRVPTGKRTGERSKEVGDQRDVRGLRINYEEKAFEDGSSRHSRFLGGVIQANTLNPDYLQEWGGPEEGKLAYVTLVIGKETIAYNDKSGGADDYLERLLGFYFKLKSRIASSSRVPGKRRPGRPRGTT